MVLEKNRNKSSSGRSKYRGRYKSPGKLVKVCWKYRKQGHYKKNCRSKNPEKGKGSDDDPSTKVKTTSDEGGNVYFSSSSFTHVDHEAWLIYSSASSHFTPHREWFYE